MYFIREITIIFILQDDITRFWREEREEGAVYSVYLKKVTYHSFSQVNKLKKKFEINFK